MTERRFDYDNLPPELTERPQWILWRKQRLGDGKLTKRPHTCQGYPASVTNPQHWSCFNYALKVWREQPGFADGIGFVFTAEDPFLGADVDDCYPSDAAEIASWAAPFEERFADTYHEKSPSGTGFKIWCKAKAPRCVKLDIGSGAIEIYDRGRFFTLTGWADDSVPRLITDHQRDVELLVANLEKLRKKNSKSDSPGGVQESIPEGQRHVTLASLAGTMWQHGMHVESIRAALHSENRLRCKTPRTPEHIDQIVESMKRWER